MNTIYKLFLKLVKNPPPKNDFYNFIDINGIKHHKLGISSNGSPMFFIKCDNKDQSAYPSYNLGITIDFGEKCTIFDGRKTISGNYTIITLNENLADLMPYFLDIILIVVKSIPPNSKLDKVKFEVDKLIELFSQILSSGSGDIQGLWAELLIIEQSRDPEYLIQSWHVNKTSVFDFNNGQDKLEVKSTKKNERIHTFSNSQLTLNKSSDLVIASILLNETGLGKNVFDLMDSISNRIKNKNILFLMNNITLNVLGDQIHKAKFVFYDYNSAKDNIAYFDIKEIPKIEAKFIPSSINNIHFDCNMNNLPKMNLKSHKSKLYRSL